MLSLSLRIGALATATKNRNECSCSQVALSICQHFLPFAGCKTESKSGFHGPMLSLKSSKARLAFAVNYSFQKMLPASHLSLLLLIFLFSLLISDRVLAVQQFNIIEYIGFIEFCLYHLVSMYLKTTLARFRQQVERGLVLLVGFGLSQKPRSSFGPS